MERLLTLAVEWADRARPVRRADLRLPGRRRSRWPIRPPTRRRRGCSPARRPGWPTAAPIPRSSTPRRRSRSCSRRRRRSAAPTGSSRSSADAATCASTRRAVLPRAARRPDLGGHLRDPAADHRPGAREARRRPGRRMSGPATDAGAASGADRPAAAVRAAIDRGGRRLAARLDRRDRPRQPAGHGQRDPLPFRQPEVRRAPRPAVLPVLAALPERAGRRDRGAQPVACRDR